MNYQPRRLSASTENDSEESQWMSVNVLLCSILALAVKCEVCGEIFVVLQGSANLLTR